MTDLVLDLRMEHDDVELIVAERLAARRRMNLKTTQVILRAEQVRCLLVGPTGAAFTSATEQLHSIFGVPIVVKADGLTPRERSIKRALAEFPPTRDEQVAKALQGEPTSMIEVVGPKDPLDPCMSCGGRDGNHERACYFA